MKVERDFIARAACGLVPLQGAHAGHEYGGKACHLARMLALGLPVPQGFVVPNAAFQRLLEHDGLGAHIAQLRAGIGAPGPTPPRADDATQLHEPAGPPQGRIPEGAARRYTNEPAGPPQGRIPEGAARRYTSEHAREIRRLVGAAPLAADLREALHAMRDALVPGGVLIVRSSAAGEDSHEASFAGQLDSIAQVTTSDQLEQALRACWASYWSERSLAYQRARAVPLGGMGVIVQQQVAAQVSGVLFTRSPDNEAVMLVEYCFGAGELLVSGRVNPGRITIAREGLQMRELAVPEQTGSTVLDQQCLQQLAHAAITLERELGHAQDIEWCIDARNRLWLVQTRPITAPAAAREVIWSNANVNENFPAPISPLLYSIASEGYTCYFRNLARAIGISARRMRAVAQPLAQIIGVHRARMYYNLSNIHAVLRVAPFGDVLVQWFDQFVGAPAAPPLPAAVPGSRFARVREGAALLRVVSKTAWQLLFLTRRVARFERTVSAYAAGTHPKRLATRSLAELNQDLQGFLAIRFERWADAGLADAAAMASYGLLAQVLHNAFPDAHRAALHNNLLKGLPGLVSSQPADELWKLSRRIRDDSHLRDLFAIDDAELILQRLRAQPQFASFSAALDTFLEDWGFRCSGELMLTVPSFQENPAALLDILKVYAARDGESPLQALDRQAALREQETARVLAALAARGIVRCLPSPRVLLVRCLVRWTQAAIKLRERARLKQALLYARLRRVALAMGERLAARGLLGAREDVFFLTCAELVELAAGSTMFPHHQSELVALRRQAQADVTQGAAPDSFHLREGAYLPPAAGSDSIVPQAGAGTVALTGVAACGGVASGRAVILEDVSAAGRLLAGDVLVTRQTDPGWAPVFFLIKGLVMERGGMLSHGAILAREYGIPTVVGVAQATARIADGARITVNGDQGVVAIDD